jgi:hypothetical protein
VSVSAALEGGCHCRAVRYRVTAPADEAGYCHCRDCQLTSGAPVLAWATFPIDAFAIIAAAPANYRSSAQGTRQFCGGCGCQLFFRDANEPEWVSINTATLDHPGEVPPNHHIYTRSRISWFEIADDLPRLQAGGEAGA